MNAFLELLSSNWMLPFIKVLVILCAEAKIVQQQQKTQFTKMFTNILKPANYCRTPKIHTPPSNAGDAHHFRDMKKNTPGHASIPQVICLAAARTHHPHSAQAHPTPPFPKGSKPRYQSNRVAVPPQQPQRLLWRTK